MADLYLNSRQVAFASALLVLGLLAGCTTVNPPPHDTRADARNVPLALPTSLTAANEPSSPASSDCASIPSMSDAAAAVSLGLNEQMLNAIKEVRPIDNATVCAMSWAERNAAMLDYRNKYRNRNKARDRAPAREYILGWDADDLGRLPTSTQILKAESTRRSILDQQTGAFSAGTAGGKAAGISTSQWSFLGPGNVGGRIRAIVFDPRNPSRFFIGAASGGIWLTINAGQSYTAIADFMGNLAIGALTIDPSNPNVMYAGTGESSTGLAGIGVFKSTDGGLTWNFLNSTTTDTTINPSGADWGTVNRIAVHPTNSNIVLAGTGYTTGALLRSTNGGQTWTKVRSESAADIQFDRLNPDRVLAAGMAGYTYLSTDAGATWTNSPKLFSNALRGRSTTARIELAWAQSQADRVYASVDNSDLTTGARGEIYRSDDGGTTWALMSSPKHLSQQGDYDNTIWVDPFDANLVVTGGLDLYRSTNGGTTFDRISTWQAAGPGLPQPHADHHVVVSPPNYGPANRTVYFGNDGGIYRSTNIDTAGANGTSTWQNLNNDLGITQFYGGAGLAAAGGKIIGGTQDNGTLLRAGGSTSTNWSRIFGGDGFFVAVDPVSDATTYGELYYAAIFRNGNFICTGITEAYKDTGTNPACGANTTEQANFNSPFILDTNNRDRMLVGANSLWVSNNVRVGTPTWTAIKPPVTNPNSTRYINAIAVETGNSNVIWVGHNASNTTGLPTQIFKTTNGLSATPTWANVAGTGMPTAAINRITVDQGNPNRVWVAYSGFSLNRLWVTDDGGTNWRSISSGLPAVTIHDVKRHPLQQNWLYVAAANGVYTSQDNGTTWTAINDGPNSVRVRELFWFDSTTLIAATYSRGMFRTTAIPDISVIGFQPVNYSVAEGGTVTLLVQRTGPLTGQASVNYATLGGTATSGADFSPISGTLTWPSGDGSTRTIVVPIVQDSILEGPETFTVVLSGATGSSIGDSKATVTIVDDEPDVFPPNCALPTAGWSKPAAADTTWEVARDSSSEGSCSLKSISPGDSPPNLFTKKSQIQFVGTFAAGTITFDRRVSSEAGWDCFRFTIDGVQQNVGSTCTATQGGAGAGGIGASGDVPWGAVRIPVSAGQRTLVWSYEKDDSTATGEDAAWIDRLVMPLAGLTPASLSVSRIGNSSGTVTSSPAGIDCGASCNASFSGSPVVTLTAIAASGAYFAGWTGCASVTTTSCQITLDAAKSVTATFTATPALAPLSKRGGVDLDGQGRSALVVRAASGNQLQAGRLVNNAFQWTAMADPGANFRLIAAVDFAGNGKSDLPMLRDNPALLNANGQGTAQFWPDFVGTAPVTLRDVKPAWDVQAVGDLDGDGFGDLVWRFRGQSPNIDDQGVSYIWFTNGSGVTQVRKRGGAPLTWTLLGAADLNADGSADMLYVSPANAMRALMATTAATAPRTCANLSAGSIPTGFAPLKLADFTGNRRGDVLIRNAASGEVRLISLNAAGLSLPAFTGDPDDQNASCTSSPLALAQTVINVSVNADPTWTYFASGDFNGDGIFDIVWKRPDNSLVLWLMNANGAAPTVISNAGSAPASSTPLSLQ